MPNLGATRANAFGLAVNEGTFPLLSLTAKLHPLRTAHRLFIFFGRPLVVVLLEGCFWPHGSESGGSLRQKLPVVFLLLSRQKTTLD